MLAAAAGEILLMTLLMTTMNLFVSKTIASLYELPLSDKVRAASLLILLLFLIAAGFMDLFSKSVPAGLFLIFLIPGIPIFCYTGFYQPLLTLDPGEITLLLRLGILMKAFSAFLPGLGLLIISRVSGGAVGIGDACFFLISALYLSPPENFLLFISGIFLAGLYSIVLLMIFRIRKTKCLVSFPFLPFLLPGFLALNFLS